MFIGSVQIIIVRDINQSKFQMLTLLSGPYICGSILRSVNLGGTFQRTLGQRTHLKLGELSSLFVAYNNTIS